VTGRGHPPPPSRIAYFDLSVPLELRKDGVLWLEALATDTYRTRDADASEQLGSGCLWSDL